MNAQQVGDEGGHRADDEVAQDDGDRHRGERDEEHLERSRHPALEPALKDRAEPHHEKDGNHRAHVAGHGHDDGEPEGGGVPRERAGHAEVDAAERLTRGQGDHRRVEERHADCHAGELVHAKLARGTERQGDGEEVEEAVSHGVEQRVEAVVCKGRDEVGDEGKQSLHDACGGKRSQDGLEDARDEVDDDGGNGLIALGLVVGACAAREVAGLQDRVVDVLDDVTHDHLVLAVSLDDLDDALEGLNLGRVGAGLVLELEAHARDAVRDAGDVLGAAYVLEYGSGQIVVFFSHYYLLSDIARAASPGRLRWWRWPVGTSRSSSCACARACRCPGCRVPRR